MMKMRFVTFGSLFALVALLLLALGANQAKADPFSPSLTTSLSCSAASTGLGLCPAPNAPGAAADINVSYGWKNNPSSDRSFPSSFSTFTPAGFNIPNNHATTGCALVAGGANTNSADCAYPMGTETGRATTVSTFGLLNGACNVGPVPVNLPGSPRSTPLENASTDTSDFLTVSAGFSNLIADTNPADGVMDGAEHWNNLLLALGLKDLNTGNPALARERSVATANLFGTTIWADNVTYDPGVLAPAALGYTTLVVVENFSPALPPTPGLITDACGLSVNLTQEGVTGTGGNCPAPVCTLPPPPPPATPLVHRSNPTAAGTVLFFLNSQSQRDADNDFFPNSMDTCPFTPNLGSPEQGPQGDSAPFGQFATDNGDNVAEAAPGDAIDSACDTNPTVNDGADADGDGFLNRQDNCPQAPNSNQRDILELGTFVPFAAAGDLPWWAGARVGPQPVDGGPRADSIGDACDVNPTVSDGHYHGALNLSPQCIVGSPTGPDSDGDGWCDGTEFVLGSNPGNPGSTPENLSIPTTCSDGIDNDLDGATDLADGTAVSAGNPTSCQLPLHDIVLNKVNGGLLICGTFTNTVDYVALIQNPSPAPPGATSDIGEIGIFVQPVPGVLDANHHTSGNGPAVTSVTGATVISSGPINDKLGAPTSNADVDWLTKAVVTGINSGSTTTVHFSVTYPPCTSPVTTSSAVDYLVTVDLCHGDDIAPLGLFGAGACEATGDGHQDRTSGNDAPKTILVNDQSK